MSGEELKMPEKQGYLQMKMSLVVSSASDRLLDKIYIDLVEPLPETLRGKKYISSIVDDLTRLVDFARLPDQEASTGARVLFNEILRRYSLP